MLPVTYCLSPRSLQSYSPRSTTHAALRTGGPPGCDHILPLYPTGMSNGPYHPPVKAPVRAPRRSAASHTRHTPTLSAAPPPPRLLPRSAPPHPDTPIPRIMSADNLPLRILPGHRADYPRPESETPPRFVPRLSRSNGPQAYLPVTPYDYRECLLFFGAILTSRIVIATSRRTFVPRVVPHLPRRHGPQAQGLPSPGATLNPHKDATTPRVTLSTPRTVLATSWTAMLTTPRIVFAMPQALLLVAARAVPLPPRTVPAPSRAVPVTPGTGTELPRINAPHDGPPSPPLSSRLGKITAHNWRVARAGHRHLCLALRGAAPAFGRALRSLLVQHRALMSI